MGTAAYMIIAAILGSIISAASAAYNQKNEFNQQQDLLNQEQDFAREREDLAYQRQKPQQMYQDYLDTGFNPNLAAQAVLGGNAETAQVGGSPSAPTTNSAIDAISSALGNGTQISIDSFMKEAQIKNLEANTNKTDVETGILPRDYMLRNLSVSKQIQLWDASITRIGKENELTQEQIDLCKKENMFYGRMSEAQINSLKSQVYRNIQEANLAIQRISESQHYEQVMDADIALRSAETANVVQDTANKVIEGNLTFYQSERERIAKEFEEKMGGIPLSVEGQKYINSLAEQGRYDEIERYFQTIFEGALNQQLGTIYGTPAKSSIDIPFLMHHENYDFQRLYNLYNMPYWNPGLVRPRGASGSW